MVLMSRTPVRRHVQRARDGRGGQRQHVHLAAQLLEPLLVRHAEALLLVDDQQAQVLELARPSDSSRCVPMTMSTLPFARRFRMSRCCLVRAEAREHLDRRPGTAPGARGRCGKCCWASTVVGTSTATCLPSMHGLERRAHAPPRSCRSPRRRRSGGPSGARCSMSALTSSMARELVLGLDVGEATPPVPPARRCRGRRRALAPPRARRTAPAARRRSPRRPAWALVLDPRPVGRAQPVQGGRLRPRPPT